MPTRELDWGNILDLDAALVAIHYELQGDWYRDPWGWPELGWVITSGKQHAIARLNASGSRRVAKIDVPKENFGTRPAIVMDPVDRLIYQALVDRVSVKLIGSLQPWVFGWRLKHPDPDNGDWSHNDIQHSAFRDTIKSAAAVSSVALRTDVVSCFASIDVERLCEMVETRAGSGRVTGRLNDLVTTWDRVAGRGGLAQRSGASSALANMYMSPVDEVLRDHNRRGRRRDKPRGILRMLGQVPRVARWMDDIWAFGSDAGRLRLLQVEIQDALRSIGLEMNHAKTELLEGDDLQREVLMVQHSAIDDALLDDDPNPQPLLELVEELLDAPTKADRTSIKFATRRLREHKIFGPVEDFARKANQMPHGADALARLFRDSKHWRSLADWYTEYTESPWGSIRWSVAQLGTAFPSKVATQADRRRLRPVEECFGKFVEGDNPLPLLAVAAQRLAAWAPDDARSLFRAAASASDNPQTRRVLALAATCAGEDRAVVRGMLNEFEENQVTLDMLKERRFKVPIKADFDG